MISALAGFLLLLFVIGFWGHAKDAWEEND